MRTVALLVSCLVLVAVRPGTPLAQETRLSSTAAPAAGASTAAEGQPPAGLPAAPQAASADPTGAPAPGAELAAEAPKPEPSPVRDELLRLIEAGKPGALPREEQAALTAFYEARRDDALLWSGPGGLNDKARLAMAEIRRADDWGLVASDFVLPDGAPLRAAPSPAALAEAELKLSLAVLKYARYARGGRMDPTQLSSYIDREPPLLPPQAVLEALAAGATPDAYLRRLHPRHPQFEKLRQAYLLLRRGGTPVQAEAPNDEPPPRRRDGKASRPAAPPEQVTARKVLLNMEQWRWMPEELGRMYVWANVPEFMVRVVKDGTVVHEERIVAGKADTQTPIFSDEMETIVFHPFWGVPDSIKVKELLPGLARGSAILERNNLRIQYRGRDIDPYSVDWTAVDIRRFHVYQPPGGSNVLGVVKFLFPNKHQVYMHDTPTKNLFSAAQRSFSHGCMRVRNPVRLAEVLLAEDKGWDGRKVAAMVRGGPQNNEISLEKKYPVHVTYFTAWVNEEGKLETRPDIYGHERLIQMGLEGKAHLIVKKKEDLGVARAEVVGRLAETRSSWAPPANWMRQVFGGF